MPKSVSTQPILLISWRVSLFNVRLGFKKQEGTSTSPIIIKPAQERCKNDCHPWDIIVSDKRNHSEQKLIHQVQPYTPLRFHSIANYTKQSHSLGIFSLFPSLQIINVPTIWHNSLKNTLSIYSFIWIYERETEKEREIWRKICIKHLSSFSPRK